MHSAIDWKWIGSNVLHFVESYPRKCGFDGIDSPARELSCVVILIVSSPFPCVWPSWAISHRWCAPELPRVTAMPSSPSTPLRPTSSPLPKVLLSTLYPLLSTLYSLLSTLYSLLSTLYPLPSTLYPLPSTLYSLLEWINRKFRQRWPAETAGIPRLVPLSSSNFSSTGTYEQRPLTAKWNSDRMINEA